LICGEHCDCIFFPPLDSVRKQRAHKFLKICELWDDHPLHLSHL